MVLSSVTTLSALSGCSVSNSGTQWKGLSAYLATCLPCDSSKATSGGGSGTASDPYLVCSTSQLAHIDTECTTQSGWTSTNFVQCSDLDLKGSAANPSSPICLGGSFKGNYEGSGFAIKNFYYNNSATSNVGVFSALIGGQISDLTVSSSSIAASSNVGGLVGAMSGGSTLTSCTATNVNVSGVGSNVGGLVGQMNSDTATNTITLSSSSGSVNCTSGRGGGGGYGTGGLVGVNAYNGASGYITHSWSSATVTGNNSRLGGIIGYADSDTHVENSYATGAISGTSSNVGGLVGYLTGGPNNSYVSHSYATGSVTSTGVNVGGLVGLGDEGNITSSYATGAVSGSASVGGLAGAFTYCGGGCTVSNSYATGSVSGSSTAGGLIGAIASLSGPGVSLTDSYSVGAVAGSGATIGGFIGQSSIAATSCFWDTTTSGQSSSATGTGETTSAMKLASTFAAWPTSATGDWVLHNGSYPALK